MSEHTSGTYYNILPNPVLFNCHLFLLFQIARETTLERRVHALYFEENAQPSWLFFFSKNFLNRYWKISLAKCISDIYSTKQAICFTNSPFLHPKI